MRILGSASSTSLARVTWATSAAVIPTGNVRITANNCVGVKLCRNSSTVTTAVTKTHALPSIERV